MTLTLTATIECDIGRCQNEMHEDTDCLALAEELFEDRGFVYMPEHGCWACPDCVKKYGGKKELLDVHDMNRDFLV